MHVTRAENGFKAGLLSQVAKRPSRRMGLMIIIRKISTQSYKLKLQQQGQRLDRRNKDIEIVAGFDDWILGDVIFFFVFLSF